MLEMALRQAALGRVGERIQQARKDKAWKQKHLAAAVHVEPQTVSRWERGESTPDLDMLERIAEKTGRPLVYFVGEEAVIPPTPDALAALREELAAIRLLTERIAEHLGA